MSASPPKLLSVHSLEVMLGQRRRSIPVVNGVSFDIAPGETLAIVGESGCGKTMTALSLLRLEPSPPMKITAGQILLNGQDLVRLSERDMTSVRGREIAMIFQEPMTSLNPTMTIGDQIVEVLTAHLGLRGKDARLRAQELLALVRLPDPARQLQEFPHRLSGGMRQRVMIAMALACNPQVLIADEPTTALDVTIQAQILHLLKDLQQRTGVGILLITHDFSVVRKVAQRVLVMYAGRVVESGDVTDVFRTPRHPYTKGLIGAMPAARPAGAARPRLAEITGSVPSPGDLPAGCSFAPRCPRADEQCRHTPPVLTKDEDGRAVACWHAEVSR